jgi:hypothetical protein
MALRPRASREPTHIEVKTEPTWEIVKLWEVSKTRGTPWRKLFCR